MKKIRVGVIKPSRAQRGVSAFSGFALTMIRSGSCSAGGLAALGAALKGAGATAPASAGEPTPSAVAAPATARALSSLRRTTRVLRASVGLGTASDDMAPSYLTRSSVTARPVRRQPTQMHANGGEDPVYYPLAAPTSHAPIAHFAGAAQTHGPNRTRFHFSASPRPAHQVKRGLACRGGRRTARTDRAAQSAPQCVLHGPGR